MSNETFYDEEIAPKLLELAKKCEGRGISFLASVEFEPGEVSRTESLQKTAGIGQKITHWAARCNGNVDILMIAIQRHAKEHGHSSAVLHLLGTPTRHDTTARREGET